MKKFKSFILEFDRADVIRRYAGASGKITLPNYDEDEADGAHTKLENIKDAIYPGIFGPNKSKEEKSELHKKFSENNFEPRQFDIKDLKPTQPHVDVSDPDRLRSKLSGESSSVVRVATHNGEHYIIDGHHTIAAALANKQSKINAQHINMDKYDV